MAVTLSDAWLDELRSRLNIVDVVAEHVALKQKGRRFWGLCPFHNEKTASFSVSEDSQLFYCFGCHKGGNVIHFVMEVERMEFLDAVTHLADKARLPMPERTQGQQAGPSRELKERIYEANKAAAHYYHDKLWTGEGAEALSYLYKRGLDDGDIRKFGLGASGAVWDDLTRALMDQGFEEDVLVRAGLTVRREDRLYDMFRERAMFPIIGAQGRVLGFGGRAKENGNPKYLNTSDTPVFNKRQELYAMNLVRKERSLKRMLLVEGYMDVLSLRKHGVEGVVATLGTALTEEQARLIKRYVPEVWVCYDGDEAGQKATLRALDIFEGTDIKVRVLAIPGGQDPDDFIRTEGIEGFNRLKPLDPVEYRMRRELEGKDMSSEEDRASYAIACCDFIKKIKSPVERENYLNRLVVQTGFDRAVLLEQIGVALSRPQPREKIRRLRPARDEDPDYVRAEKTLIMLMGAKLIDLSAVQPEDFETELFAEMANKLRDGQSAAKLLDALEDDERMRAAEALNSEIPPDEHSALIVAEDCLRRIHRYRIEKSIERLRDELLHADGLEKLELTKKLKELTQESQRLKTGRKE